MAKVNWTLEAVGDLEQIQAFIARDSEYQAALFTKRIYAAVAQLAEFPESGRVIPEVGAGRYRELIEGPYRIMYSLWGEDVMIDAVIHGAREFRADD